MFIADIVTSPTTNETHTAVGMGKKSIIKFFENEEINYCFTIEWLFTITPGLFGLIPGYANLTGWALVAILIVMVLCSLPCVRKSGSFEV